MSNIIKETTYILKQTWLSKKTAKLQGGYLIFYSECIGGCWFDTFKFTRCKNKASILTKATMLNNIEDFGLNNVERLIYNNKEN